jgi:hypothetical protein
MASGPQPDRPDARSPAGAAEGEGGASDRRKAEPVNVPLPRTLAWAAELPGEVRPHMLLRSFARIANLIASQWDEPKALYAYFGELLIDRRKDRKGFPPEVTRELLALREYYSFLDLQRSTTRHKEPKR